MFDAVIPARNEASTIAEVVGAFRRHRKINRVIVAIDADTSDNTATVAYHAGAGIVQTGVSGKGQVVQAALTEVTTNEVIFCDADYWNLSRWHISRICQYPRKNIQLIGEPDIPFNYPPAKGWAWPWVSGFRRIPTAVAQCVHLHGYLMEVQLNEECRRMGIPTMITRMMGLISPYEMTESRRSERDRDFAWGQKNGVIPSNARLPEPNQTQTTPEEDRQQ